MTKILITGATGYIGTNLFHLLSSKGYSVYGLSNSQTKKRISKISLLNKNKLNSYLKKNKFDVVIHLASILEDKNPQKILHNNFSSTLNLLESCLQNNVKNFIFTSSHAVYGKTNYLPIDEMHNTSPESAYGITKIMEENLCKFFTNYFDLNTIILRISSVYGAEQKKTKLIPSMILSGLNNNELILHKHKNGFQIMDLIHIDDVCNSILCSLKNLKKPGIYNIASSSSITVKDISNQIQKINHCKITIKKTNFHTNHFTYDTKKAKKFLKFSSKIKFEKIFPTIYQKTVQNN